MESAATTTLSTVITNEMLSGVLNEVIGLLPTCIPVMITFIALRKRHSFLTINLTLCIRVWRLGYKHSSL